MSGLDQFDWYQDMAMDTRLTTASTTYALLGLSGEVGELHGRLAKDIRDQQFTDRDYVKKELGDILWFVAALADDYGWSLSDVASANLKKLQSRKQRGVLQGSGDDR